MAERATKDRRMKSAVIELWQFTTQTKNRESEEMAQTKPDSSANWHHKRKQKAAFKYTKPSTNSNLPTEVKH